MAALIDEAADPRAASGVPAPDALSQTLYGKAVTPVSQGEMAHHSHTASVFKNVMPDLVKGAGLAPRGGNTPLTDQAQILTKAAQATVDLRAATWQGWRNKASVVKGMNPNFLSKYGALKTALEAPSVMDQVSSLVRMIPGGQEALEKSFTAGNLGIGSIN